MKKKTVWRYYCDYCGKSKGTESAMKTHESGCTENPGRKCRICAFTKSTQQPIESLVAAFNRGGIDELRNEADGCPACMLAAVRKIQGKTPFENFDDSSWIDWNYKKEHDSFWSDINDDRRAIHDY